MRTDYNNIHPDDRDLFDRMIASPSSQNEKRFFETLKYRQTYVFTYANDLLLSEDANSDGVYILRIQFEEYEIGTHSHEPVHTMNLTAALETRLSEIGIQGNDTTLLEWLQSRDYEGIDYNGNFDEV